MILQLLALILGVFACSTAVILIKASTVHPFLLSGYRLLFASILLTPVFLHYRRVHRGQFTRRHLRRIIWPALLLAAHFISWTIGARLTGAANASVIVNLTPLITPFLLGLLGIELVTRGEIVGTGLAMVGVFLLSAADFHASPDYLLGDVLCFGSMVLFAAYLVLARLNRDFPSLWLYLVPLYAAASVFCFIAAVPVTDVFTLYPANQYLYLLGLALIPTIIGHSLLNRAMKHLRGQLVSIVNLGQFFFAGVMAYVVFHEVPSRLFYLASLLILLGAAIALRATPEKA